MKCFAFIPPILALAALPLVSSLGQPSSDVASVQLASLPGLTSTELIARTYLALVKESIVPANPRAIALAALSAMALTSGVPVDTLPSDFGIEPDRDARWVAAHATDLPIPWPTVDAMAQAANTAHTWLITPQRKTGMRAMASGHPVSSPGFQVCTLTDGRIAVFTVAKGGSADLSGLEKGDVILRLNDEPVTRTLGLQLTALPAGSTVTLEVERARQRRRIHLRLVQANLCSVESKIVDRDIGYVAIRCFSRSNDATIDTATLARNAFATLAAKGARGLILDLRSALGGIGEVQIASSLFHGETIYFLKQPLASPARAIKREGDRCWPDRPIVVLLNEHTISAGEALALALRELGNAKIVGQTSGGGLTEFSFVTLADGYALTIPTGVVLGPISAQDQPGHAIKPDLDVSNPSVEELREGHDRQLDAAVKECRNSSF